MMQTYFKKGKKKGTQGINTTEQKHTGIINYIIKKQTMTVNELK